MQLRFLFVIAAFALIPDPVTVAQTASKTTTRRAQETTVVAATERFEFHSDPWINFHHFLYQWAREDLGLNTGRRHVPVPERSSLRDLSGQSRAAWLQAVGFYRTSVARKSHWDLDMLRLKRDLLKLGGDPRASPPDAINGISAALKLAMPGYRDKWWPQHDKANRKWIESVESRLRRYEKRYVEMTVRVHGAVWPKDRWRVDVSAYANPRGGYTTREGHIVMYSTDPGNQDLYALEMVFHEIQHAEVIGGATPRALVRAFEAAGAELPPNLAHALIFATAGEFVRSIAASEGRPEYTPYWVREGFESLEDWGKLVPLVSQHWLRVVRGEVSPEEGLAALATAFARRL